MIQSPAVGRHATTRGEATTLPSILLVDDHPANLLAIEAILAPLPVRCFSAHSGEEALLHMLRSEFALVLLDVQMPKMDGYETAAAIRAHPRMAGIPIIFVTALNVDSAHIFKGYANGAVDYILKPFDPDILRAKVSIFVELWRKGETIKAQAKLLHQREIESIERRNEQRLRRLTDLMPLLMLGARPDGSVYYANRAWSDYTGLDADGTKWVDNRELIHPEDAENASLQWRRALTGVAPLELQCRLRRAKDGAWRWFMINAVPERGDGGSLEGWIATGADIDDQKQVEAARQELLERERVGRQAAETATRIKDEFLAAVSHELRTPLHSILGWVQMARSGMLDAARMSRALETIQRNAEAQRRLIDDLLDVSRIVRGKLKLQRRRVDAVALTKAVVETMRPISDAKGVELSLRSSPPEAFLWADADRFQQIMTNLVTNAVKFTSRGGSIFLDVACTDDELRIDVTDTGAGISEEFLPFVFERFRQQDSSTTRAYQGLGLGLAIVHHLVELHDGQVLASSPGVSKGSCFSVKLPTRSMRDDEPALLWIDKARRPGEEPVDLSGLRVLFVDDHAEALELFKRLFEDRGAHVVAVDTAAAALNSIRSEEFDVIVSDIGMQDEDGYSFIRQVRMLSDLRKSATPAVAISGFSATEDGRRALTAGFQVFLTKPVDPSELFSLVLSLSAPTSVS